MSNMIMISKTLNLISSVRFRIEALIFLIEIVIALIIKQEVNFMEFSSKRIKYSSVIQEFDVIFTKCGRPKYYRIEELAIQDLNL